MAAAGHMHARRPKVSTPPREIAHDAHNTRDGGQLASAHLGSLQPWVRRRCAHVRIVTDTKLRHGRRLSDLQLASLPTKSSQLSG